MTMIGREDQEHLARLVEESIMTLNEVDQRIQALRNGLAQYAPHLGLAGAGEPRAPGTVAGAPAVSGAPFAGQPAPGMYAAGGPLGAMTRMPQSLQGLAGLPPRGTPLGPHPLMGGQMGWGRGMGGATPVGAPDAGAAIGATPMPGLGGPHGGSAPGLGGAYDALARAGLPGSGMAGQGVRTPPVDVFDKGGEYVVQVEVPGVRKDDLEVMANERFISLRGTTRPDHQPSERVMGERGQVTYMRTIPLPAEVQAGKVRAVFRDGILTLTAPKKEGGEGARRVEITE